MSICIRLIICVWCLPRWIIISHFFYIRDSNAPDKLKELANKLVCAKIRAAYILVKAYNLASDYEEAIQNTH